MIDQETREYARRLPETATTAWLVEIRNLVSLYNDRRGPFSREECDALVVLVDDLDRYLCAGAPLPGEWLGRGVPRALGGADLAEALAHASTEVDRARTATLAAEQARRHLVVKALDAGLPAVDIASCTGVTRSAIYQMRDAEKEKES